MATEEVGVRLSVKGRREAAKALRDTADDVGKIDRKLDGIDGSSRKAARALDRAAQAGKRFGKGLAIGIGVGVAAMGAATFAFARLARGWISSAAEQARLTRLTEAAIVSTGAAAGVTAKQVEDLSNSISNATAVEDEVVQGAANLLLTFTKVRNEVGKGNDIFNQATQSAIDMSVALGTDANGAALQLGKALNDPIKGVTALSRAGVSFTQQQKDQIKTLVNSGKTLEAQKVILSEMSTQFGGAAAAAADPMERLRVIVGNVGQRIGFMLLPYVERFTNFLIARGVPIVEGFLDEFDRGVGAGGRLRDRMEELRAKGVQLWEEFRTGTGTGGQLRDALATAGEAAAILGQVARDVVLPAIAWFADHPDALKAVAASMAGMAVSAKAIAAANVLSSLLALGGVRGVDGAAKKASGGKKLPVIGFGGPLGIAAGVAGTLAVNDWMSQTDAPKPGAKPNVTGERIGGPTGPKLYPAVPTQPSRQQVDLGGTGRRYADDRRPVMAQVVMPDGKVLAEAMLDGLYTTQARK